MLIYDSPKGNVENNTISINGGKVGFISGGFSKEGDVENSTISINGGEITGSIRGGFSEEKNVESNTITIEGGTFSATTEIVGYKVSSAGTATNNTINIKVSDLNIASLRDTNNLYFYLPSSVKDGDTVITLRSADLSNTTIGVRPMPGTTLETGDEIVLIEGNLATDATLSNKTAQMTDGLTSYKFSLRRENNQLIAKVMDISIIFYDSFESQP